VVDEVDGEGDGDRGILTTVLDGSPVKKPSLLSMTAFFVLTYLLSADYGRKSLAKNLCLQLRVERQTWRKYPSQAWWDLTPKSSFFDWSID
jgi:hypothetical protein